MFSSMFNPENDFWQWLSRVCDVVGLSVCWVFCSLPILTAGAATTALYDAMARGVRGREAVVYGRFFRTFRANLKVGALSSLIGAALAALLWFFWTATLLLAEAGVAGAPLLLAVYQVVFCLPLGVWLTAQVLLSRFEFRLGPLLKTAAQLALAQLPRVAVVTVLAVLFARLCALFIFPVLLLPGLWAWLVVPLYEKMFAPFLPKEEE